VAEPVRSGRARPLVTIPQLLKGLLSTRLALRAFVRPTLVFVVAATAGLAAAHRTFSVEERLSVLNRASVWEARDPAVLDVLAGPEAAGSFAPDAVVSCDYAGATTSGRSPKFNCAITKTDKVKVKYGQENGEVYSEVAATRLLWLLGFYADRMYPVRVMCHGCPKKIGGTPTGEKDVVEVAFAAIEREMKGTEVELEHRRGWEWGELDIAKGSTRAQRDALKLVSVMLQHTDSKSEQQRLLCPGDDCEHPVAMVNDLGLTFGRASLYNRNSVSSANLHEWSRAPVWEGKAGCVGNLAKSYTGSLDRPHISEEGRALRADRLQRISDAQLHDLFSVARFDKRRGDSIDAWVAAFKEKRDEIAARRCDN